MPEGFLITVPLSCTNNCRHCKTNAGSLWTDRCERGFDLWSTGSVDIVAVVSLSMFLKWLGLSIQPNECAAH